MISEFFPGKGPWAIAPVSAMLDVPGACACTRPNTGAAPQQICAVRLGPAFNQSGTRTGEHGAWRMHQTTAKVLHRDQKAARSVLVQALVRNAERGPSDIQRSTAIAMSPLTIPCSLHFNTGQGRWNHHTR